MNSNSTIRIGVIGAGGNTKAQHIPKLQAIKGVEIAMVCNQSVASGQKVADEFGIPEVAAHWTEVVEDMNLDAVVIGTWPNMHCPITLEALTTGKHVLTEARMAMNAAEAREMFEMSRRFPELTAQVVPAPFTLGLDKTIQRLIGQNYLGDILAIKLDVSGNAFVDRDAAFNWRMDTDRSGMNVMMMGIYYESLMRWVGPAKSVMAMSQTSVKRRNNADGQARAVAVPDHVNVVAEMVCGAQASMQFSAITGLGASNEISLYGSEGTLRIDISDQKIYGAQRKDRVLKEIKVRKADRDQWRVEEEFINAIRGKEQIQLTTFADGLKYMEFTEAVALSASTGELTAV